MHLAVGQNPVTPVNSKIGGKWMFIHPNMARHMQPMAISWWIESPKGLNGLSHWKHTIDQKGIPACPCFPTSWGSKFKSQGTTGFSLLFHLPGFHFGPLCLSQATMQALYSRCSRSTVPSPFFPGILLFRKPSNTQEK